MMNLEEITQNFLRGMGEAHEEFKPSSFQLQALSLLRERKDVIVVAPTGSGKTWIAQEFIRERLEQGKKCWYTTPLKALSNQKFDFFRRLFGEENVGLLTGERRENSSAPLIVATTEILRNHLYSGDEVPEFVVLDEAHYISDPERGTTWEEVIILSPPFVQFLLLSATISNATEIRNWMASVREREPALVICRERPVPLRMGILTPNGYVLPLQGTAGGPIFGKFEPISAVKALERRSLLPAIIFLPRRRDCDRAAWAFRGVVAEGVEERERMFQDLARDYPSLRSHPLAEILISAGIAPHHAGHLTSWKIAVERMLSSGLLRAVFSTSTLAAGLDVPARTVILPEQTLRGVLMPLTPLEFHQMTGRAGRRGRDKVGFALVSISSRRGLWLARLLADSKPEELRSAFRIQYYQVLNLLSRYGYGGAMELLGKSLLVYQRAKVSRKGEKRARRELEEEFTRRCGVLAELGYLSKDYELTEDGEWAKKVRHVNSIFITESVKAGILEEFDLPELCGWAGALSGEKAPPNAVTKISLDRLLSVAKKIVKLERRWGLEPSSILLELRREGRWSLAEKRASVVKAWAEGASWWFLVGRSGLEGGDLQRLILQSAEVLRQVENLPLPSCERVPQAREKLFRAPVGE
jgi:superfamily II RNA helicase